MYVCVRARQVKRKEQLSTEAVRGVGFVIKHVDKAMVKKVKDWRKMLEQDSLTDNVTC